MSNTAPIVDRIRIIPRPDDFLDRNVGSSGEVFFNKQSNSLRVYSGKDRSGFEIARADLSNVDTSAFLSQSDLNNLSIEEFQDVDYMLGPPTDGQVLVWRTDHWMPEDIQAGGASVDVSDTAPSDPSPGNLWLDTNTGKLYIYYNDGDSSQWIQPTTSTGGSGSGPASDANTLQGEAGSYYLNYNNFTNTPTIPSSILDLGISDGSSGQVLATDGAGNFAFTTVSGGGGGGGVDLTALSVTVAAPAGTPNLAYNNVSGVFTYTPPDLSSYLTAETDTFATVTARGATTNTAITINNTLTVDDIQASGTGNPEIVSASTFSITAPDGVTANGVPLPTYGGKLVLGASPTWTGSSGISVAQTSAGLYTVTFTTAYGAATDYIISATHQEWLSAPDVLFNIEKAAGSFTITIQRASTGANVDEGEMALLIYEF